MANPAMANPAGALRAAAKPLLLIAGLAAAGYALRALPVHDFAQHAGRLGDLSFILLGAAVCAVGAPRQIVAFAAGYAHGVWLGLLLALAAQLLGCLADLLWARLVAGAWLRARAGTGRSAMLARLDRFLAAQPFTATLTLRLLPVGNNLALNLFAGAFAIPTVPFAAATALGYLPQTIVFVLLGKGIRVDRGAEIAVAVAAFAVSLALGALLLRKARPGAPPLPYPASAAETPSNSLAPSVPPSSGSTRSSGCGISPSTRRLGL
jgi:uncharacterized membrane protein YdjX (TVP38/TMEM64 family)